MRFIVGSRVQQTTPLRRFVGVVVEVLPLARDGEPMYLVRFSPQPNGQLFRMRESKITEPR